jgi:ABC-2 type transport system permease protein
MIHVARAVAWRLIYKAFTLPTFLLPALLFPMIFFLGFAGALGRVAEVPGFDYGPGYEAFQFAFVLLQSAAMAGVFTGFNIAHDFERGFARRLLIAAPRRSEIIVGYAIATIVRWSVNISIVFLTALIVGMDVQGGPFDLFGLLVLGFALNVIGTLWAAGVALRLRSAQAGPIMQLPIFLLIFLAPVFVPLHLLEGWIHGVATVNPFTHLLAAARSLLAGGTTDVAFAFAIVVPLGFAFALWALRGLRRAEAAGG